jgi:hypothetical protein
VPVKLGDNNTNIQSLNIRQKKFMLLDKKALQKPRKRRRRQMFLRERWQTFLQFTCVMRSEKGQHNARCSSYHEAFITKSKKKKPYVEAISVRPSLIQYQHCRIFKKFSTSVLHKTLLIKCQFRHSRFSNFNSGLKSISTRNLHIS